MREKKGEGRQKKVREERAWVSMGAHLCVEKEAMQLSKEEV